MNHLTMKFSPVSW